MSLREAAQQALEALHLIRDGATGLYGDDLTRCNLALEMLSAALAEDVLEINFGNIPQPVAYISGYHKGRCIIEAVDRNVLLPVGMALYRSPPNQSEDALGMVKPVAWCVAYDDPLMGRIYSNPTMYQPEAKALVAQADSPLSLVSLYPSSFRREPLTDEEIIKMWQAIDHGKIGHTIDFARAIERAHGIGGEE